MVELLRKRDVLQKGQTLMQESNSCVAEKISKTDITDVRSPLLTTGEAAKFLGYSPRSLNNSRVSGLLGGVPAPKFVKLGRAVRYKKDTLEKWVHQFDEQQNTAQSC